MKKKAFTLIELIAVLVIVVIIFLSATILVKIIVEKAKKNAQRKNIDAYGRAVELAVSEYLLDTGEKANDINLLNIKYNGAEVLCGVQVVYHNHVFLSNCSVDGISVRDSKSSDGYYHYGNIVEFGDIYSEAVRKALWRYRLDHNDRLPLKVSDLELKMDDYNFSCEEKKINSDGTFYLSKCSLSGVDILSNQTTDGYYHWGDEKFRVGDIVKYNNIDFYVIENTNGDKDTVHLLKKNPIKSSDLSSYLNEIGLDNKVDLSNSYLSTQFCYDRDCIYDYKTSDLKKIVDLWGEKYINLDDLVKDKSGYMIRVPNDTDVFNEMQYHPGNTEYGANDGGGTELHYTTDLDFHFSGIWCMSRISDDDYSVSAMVNNYLYSASIRYATGTYNNRGILQVSPVINVKKSALDN